APKEEENGGPESYPKDLLAGWERRDRWWGLEGYRLDPEAFHRMEAGLLELENAWRSGGGLQDRAARLGRGADGARAIGAGGKGASPPGARGRGAWRGRGAGSPPRGPAPLSRPCSSPGTGRPSASSPRS